MQFGDKVYFHHISKVGVEVRYPAVVLGVDEAVVTIRFGRLNTHNQQIDTYRHEVGVEVLTARGVPCAFEDQLRGDSA